MYDWLSLTRQVRKSFSTKSDVQSHCSKSDELTDCTATHGSDDALKINKVHCT